MLEKKRKPLLLALGAAVLIIGGGAAYFLLVQRNIFFGDAPAGAQLIPQDALVTASISTDSEQWQQLRKYGTPETQAALDAQLKQLQEALLTANGYNYEKDIKPWLGKTVMIAYLPSGAATAQVASFVKQPDLMVLPIDKPTEAKQLLEKAKSQAGKQLAERTYKGISIRETQKNQAQNYSLAIVDRFLVVTNNPKTTERVIDTYKSDQGAASVAATSGYAENLGKISASNPFAKLYLNGPVVSAAAAANSSRAISPEKLAATQQRQGVAATVTLEPEGMRFRGISWLKPNSTQKYQVENTTNRLARRLPGDTLMMFSGGNLSRFWQDNAQSTESNPLSLISPTNLNAGLKTAFGLSFEEDLLPWMDGEFSLALIPASPEALTQPGNQSVQLGAGVVLMVKASDRSRAEKTFQQLDQVMATRYQFQVEKAQVKGQPVVNWNSPLGGLSASHGWLDGNVAFLTLGAPIAGAVLPQPQAPLSDNQLFQQTVPTQPNPNNGQLFLDVDRAINNGTLNLSQLLRQEQRLLAKGMRSIGVTSAINDQRSIRFDMFVQMKTVAPDSSPSPSASVSPTPQVSPSTSVSPTPQVSPSTSVSPTPQVSPSS